jgi:ribose transport system substrate-binding protein
VVVKALRSIPSKARLLNWALNDPCAVRALEAIQQAKRGKYSAVAGRNATAELREKIYYGNKTLIGWVAYFPEHYGEKLIRLALSILNRETVPLAVHTHHVFLAGQNIVEYYPRDSSLRR